MPLGEDARVARRSPFEIHRPWRAIADAGKWFEKLLRHRFDFCRFVLENLLRLRADPFARASKRLEPPGAVDELVMSNGAARGCLGGPLYRSSAATIAVKAFFFTFFGTIVAMRVMGVILALVLAAPAASAQVQLIIKKDGSKVIVNVPSGHGQKATSDFKWLALQHDRPSRYDLLIEKYAKKFRVDPTLVRAVIQVESDFDPLCVSRKGARGLMQLMPETAKKYGVTQVHDPEQNIRAGILHLREMLEMFTDLPRALAAYNAGPNAVLKYGGIPPYQETTTYVKRALTVYYGHPYGQAVIFAGGKKPQLRGGFANKMTQPIVAMMPGVRYLGTQ